MDAPVASPSLVGRMGASLAGEWRQAGPTQRFGDLVSGFTREPPINNLWV